MGRGGGNGMRGVVGGRAGGGRGGEEELVGVGLGGMVWCGDILLIVK